jgi:hypothetical protein
MHGHVELRTTPDGGTADAGRDGSGAVESSVDSSTNVGTPVSTATTILGQFAVPPAERVRHTAVASFKSAMLEAYADEDGQWNWFSQSRAQESLRQATRLDPDNLDAFSVAQKLLIREGRFDEARANIAARRARCRTGEWLCDDVCFYLEQMMRAPADAR